MGTPEFALPALTALNDSGAFDLRAVITQPDKPAGRGQKLQPSPVKQRALELRLPVYEPATIRGLRLDAGRRFYFDNAQAGSELVDLLNAEEPPDAIVVVAYGKIIPDSLLEFPRRGLVNVHPSLLPRWRGAAPIQRAIFAGDRITGVSLMQVNTGLDTGPVFCSEQISIGDDNFGALNDRLAVLGARMLVEHLPAVIAGGLLARPQSNDGATYAEKWGKEDLEIRWEEPAAVTLRRLRSSTPEPGIRATLDGELIKIYDAAAVVNHSTELSAPGTVVESSADKLVVACGERGFLSITELQFPGRKRLSIREAQRGRPLKIGQRFQ